MWNDHSEFQTALEPTRRHFLQDCGLGLGAIALGGMQAESAEVFSPPKAKVKSVIYLFMAGAPTPTGVVLDYKPKLTRVPRQTSAATPV